MSEKNYSKTFANLCRKASREKYRIVHISGMHERTEKEICNAIHARSCLLFLAAHEVIEYCKSKNIPYGCGYSSRFHLLAYYLGITEVNPLPVHYECECGNFEWIKTEQFKKEEYPDGFDLPDKECPKCGKTMRGDGHNLPQRNDIIHSINIPVKPCFRDEIVAHLKEAFSDLKTENLKFVDSNKNTHQLAYSFTVMPKGYKAPEDCFTQSIPFGSLVLSDYEPLAPFDLLAEKTGTDLSSIKFNDTKIYNSFYHYEEDVLNGNSLVWNYVKLPQDFYLLERATTFSDFVRHLGIIKFLSEISDNSSYLDIIEGANLTDFNFYLQEIKIARIPYCTEEFIDTLERYDLRKEIIQTIIDLGQAGKKNIVEVIPHKIRKYFESWLIDIVNNNRFLHDKQRLVMEAMELYRTQYFVTEHPAEFFKCKMNEIKHNL